jgi:hypothetical protein
MYAPLNLSKVKSLKVVKSDMPAGEPGAATARAREPERDTSSEQKQKQKANGRYAG